MKMLAEDFNNDFTSQRFHINTRANCTTQRDCHFNSI